MHFGRLCKKSNMNNLTFLCKCVTIVLVTKRQALKGGPMKKIVCSFMGTLLVAVTVVLIGLLVKGISMLPLGSIGSFLLNSWPTLLVGVVIAHVGQLLGDRLFTGGRRRHRHRDENGDE